MCGIVGFVNFEKDITNSLTILSTMPLVKSVDSVIRVY